MFFLKRRSLRQSIINHTLLPQEDTVVLHSSDSSLIFFFPHLELVSQALCFPNMLTLPPPPASGAGICHEDKRGAPAGLQEDCSGREALLPPAMLLTPVIWAHPLTAAVCCLSYATGT